METNCNSSTISFRFFAKLIMAADGNIQCQKDAQYAFASILLFYNIVCTYYLCIFVSLYIRSIIILTLI